MPRTWSRSACCAGRNRFGEFKGHTRPEFLAWMGAILDHLIQHQHRFWTRKKRDRKREQPLTATGGGPGEPAGSTTSILGRLVREEEWEQLMVAAGWCREEDRAVISLHLFEGRSHEEIAAEWVSPPRPCASDSAGRSAASARR